MKELEAIAQRFFKCQHWVGARPFGAGNINDTYRIEFKQDGAIRIFILQRINQQVFRQPEALMRNICRVTSHVKSSAFPYEIPAPIPALDGQVFYLDSERNYWRCFPYIPNSYAPEGKTDVDMAFEAAKAYGAFARALQDFPAGELSETIPGFHDTDLRWEAFLEVLEADPVQRVDRSAAEISAIFQAIPVFEKVSRLKKSGALPLRVTHNDTKAGNVLFSKKTHKALAVIDLDTVMPGCILSDFGDMVRTFVPDKLEDEPTPITLRPEILEALRAGYLNETDDFLTATEKEHLLLGGAWITGEQALRFLTDWLAGDVYYKIKHPEHNLLRTRNQLAVFQQLAKLMMNDE